MEKKVCCTKTEANFLCLESDLAKRFRDVPHFAPFSYTLGVCPMFKKIVLSLFAATVIAGFASNSCMAQSTQSFKVVVPQSLSIVAPAAVTLTHNETDNPQAFPAQSWVVKGNVLAGVNVSFATATPFVHSTDNTYKRNAKLDLALGTVQGPATWTVGTATDTTDYVANDGIAQVTASSNGVGRANFNLTVSFITEQYGVFAAGDYLTTVTGTIAAK